MYVCYKVKAEYGICTRYAKVEFKYYYYYEYIAFHKFSVEKVCP